MSNKKIKICLDDPETRAVWETALEARREVASWPAWKRGEEEPVKKPKPEAKLKKKPKKPDAVAKQYGFTKNPFSSLTANPNAKEFCLHVYWSGLDDGGDDGRGHLVQRGKVTCDMGLENFPNPPPTAEEMQQVMFAAKIALARVLRTRKRVKK